MQYEFKDFGQTATPLSPSIRIILNGRVLDEYLSNASFSFQTLTVEGRGKTSYNVATTDIDGMHGSMLDNTTLNNRVITVRAKVFAVSNEAYREGMSRLNLLGYGRKIHDLQFTDDVGYTFYATCGRIEDEDERSNTQIVEMEFVCTNPYKYSDPKTVTSTNAQPTDIDTDIPVVADEIELTFSNASRARDWTLSNQRDGYRIRYQQEGTAGGTVIRIRQRENYIGYIDSTNNIGDLNLRYSEFDEFTIFNGDQLVVTPEPTQIKITYKGARL